MRKLGERRTMARVGRWRLTDLSHHLPAADAAMLAVTGHTRYSRSDVLSATPAPTFTACTPSQRHLAALATKPGETSGLTRGDKKCHDRRGCLAVGHDRCRPFGKCLDQPDYEDDQDDLSAARHRGQALRQLGRCLIFFFVAHSRLLPCTRRRILPGILPGVIVIFWETA